MKFSFTILYILMTGFLNAQFFSVQPIFLKSNPLDKNRSNGQSEDNIQIDKQGNADTVINENTSSGEEETTATKKIDEKPSQPTQPINYTFQLSEFNNEYTVKILGEGDTVINKGNVSIENFRVFEHDLKKIIQEVGLEVDATKNTFYELFINILLDKTKSPEEPTAGFLKMKENDSLPIYYGGVHYNTKIVRVVSDSSSHDFFKKVYIDTSCRSEDSNLAKSKNKNYNLSLINKSDIDKSKDENGSEHEDVKEVDSGDENNGKIKSGEEGDVEEENNETNKEEIHTTEQVKNLIVLRNRKRVRGFFIDKNSESGTNMNVFISKVKFCDKRRFKRTVYAKKLYAFQFNSKSDKGIDYEVFYKPKKNVPPELYDFKGKINNIQLEFKDGYINKVAVSVDVKGEKQVFYNLLPIPFSSIRDIKKLDLIYLHNKDYASKDKNKSFAIKLSEVITYYKPYLNNGRKDYSPDNITYEFEPSDEVRKITKSATQELFTAKSFTDILGVNESAPNGLVQLEFSRKFNLYNHRYPLIPNIKGLANIGHLQYFDVTATISKVENNNRFLDLRSYFAPQDDASQIAEIKNYINPIDLLRHEFFSFRADLNILHFDLPELKLEIDLNMAYRVGLSAVQDTVREFRDNEFIATNAVERNTVLHNTILPYIKISSQLEERFGIDFKYGLGYMFMSESNIDFVSSYRRFEEKIDSPVQYKSKRKDLSYGFFCTNFWFNPSAGNTKRNERALNSGQFFLRFIFNYSFIERSQKFYQAQLGYSFNISKSNTSQKP